MFDTATTNVTEALKALATPAANPAQPVDVAALFARIATLEAAVKEPPKSTRASPEGLPFIKKGKATANHAVSLRSLGYTVEEDNENFYINAEFYAGAELPVEKLQDVVKAKQVISYRTKVIIGGEKFWSIPLCGKLGELSCLICKGDIPPTGKKKSAGVPSIEEMLAALGKKK